MSPRVALAFAIGAWLFVGVACLTPVKSLPFEPLFFDFDKVAHAAIGFGLVVTAWPVARNIARRAWVVSGLALGYGALIEVIQGVVPGRSADLWDLVATGVGVAIAAAFMAHRDRDRGAQGRGEHGTGDTAAGPDGGAARHNAPL